MTRRVFMACATGAIGRAAANQPRLAITMDDVNWMRLADPMRANARLLDAMRAHRARLALFVIGRNSDSETGQRIVRTWKTAGHLIGNHTYSHRNYNAVTFEEFSADVIHAGNVLAASLSTPHRLRFPVLKEGDTAEKRDRMREFLARNGYRNGHVTIDASDWYYDNRLREHLKADPAFDVNRFRQPYLDHLWDRAQFYDGLSKDVLGRSVPHTILLHYNLLNSLFLGDVLDNFRQRGWQIIDAEDAYRDPVFRMEPKNVPAGESLLWALAKETGKFENVLRYPGEDDVYEKPKLDRLGL
jgi:peptidoglycan/xylan/chitin deacetylase (PgdA/CDA1 family)